MDISNEIIRLKSEIEKERIDKRIEFENKARKAILTNIDSLTHSSFDLIMSIMNSDIRNGKINTDRFYPLFSTPQRNIIKTTDIEQVKTLIITAFEKEDLPKIDGIKIRGIKYGAPSLFLYMKNSDKYNVYIPSTVRGLKVAYPEKAKDIIYGEPFSKNYLVFNTLCNELKQKYSIKPQELDIILVRLDRFVKQQLDNTADSNNTATVNDETAYFILRTGGGEYDDQPKVKYNFKEGIPGYKQLIKAANNAKFVYIKNNTFYGKGKIGSISTYTKNGTKYFDAKILDYKEIRPVQYIDISDKLSKSLSQAGIMKISYEDYRLLTGETSFIDVSLTNISAIEQLSLDTFIPKEILQEWEDLLRDRMQIIFYGPPGTGKTFVAEKIAKYVIATNGKTKLVTFHPSYGYEDFVEGIKPIPVNEGAQIKYESAPGILKQIVEEAKKEPNKRFVLLVDEINRGNIAKIFGELIHCLEYRGEQHKVTLPYSQEDFYLPNNVFIIGTMNSADRSIALVDYALRRRFCFIEFMPKEKILEDWLSASVINIDKAKIVECLRKINAEISSDPKLGKHFQIGHSYFMQKGLDEKKIDQIWKYDIKPLLEEYYFEDTDAIAKIQKIFDDTFHPNQLQTAVLPTSTQTSKPLANTTTVPLTNTSQSSSSDAV